MDKAAIPTRRVEVLAYADALATRITSYEPAPSNELDARAIFTLCAAAVERSEATGTYSSRSAARHVRVLA